MSKTSHFTQQVELKESTEISSETKELSQKENINVVEEVAECSNKDSSKNKNAAALNEGNIIQDLTKNQEIELIDTVSRQTVDPITQAGSKFKDENGATENNDEAAKRNNGVSLVENELGQTTLDCSQENLQKLPDTHQTKTKVKSSKSRENDESGSDDTKNIEQAVNAGPQNSAEEAEPKTQLKQNETESKHEAYISSSEVSYHQDKPVNSDKTENTNTNMEKLMQTTSERSVVDVESSTKLENQEESASSAALPKVTEGTVPDDNRNVSEHSTDYSNDKTKALEMGILAGRISMDELPPLSKKVVRVFLSSTFSGTCLILNFYLLKFMRRHKRRTKRFYATCLPACCRIVSRKIWFGVSGISSFLLQCHD